MDVLKVKKNNNEAAVLTRTCAVFDAQGVSLDDRLAAMGAKVEEVTDNDVVLYPNIIYKWAEDVSGDMNIELAGNNASKVCEYMLDFVLADVVGVTIAYSDETEIKWLASPTFEAGHYQVSISNGCAVAAKFEEENG